MLQHTSSALSVRLPVAWEGGIIVRQSGNACGLYPPVVPSTIASHAPHPLEAMQCTPRPTYLHNVVPRYTPSWRRAISPLLSVPLGALRHATHAAEPYPDQFADCQVTAVTSSPDTGEAASAVTPPSPALPERLNPDQRSSFMRVWA